MKTLTLITFIILFWSQSKSQTFQDFNCIGLTTTEVSSKMYKFYGSSDQVIHRLPDSLIVKYHDSKFGQILFISNNKNICYRIRFMLNYRTSDYLMNNEYTFTNCKKKVTKLKDYYNIDFTHK